MAHGKHKQSPHQWLRRKGMFAFAQIIKCCSNCATVQASATANKMFILVSATSKKHSGVQLLQCMTTMTTCTCTPSSLHQHKIVKHYL